MNLHQSFLLKPLKGELFNVKIACYDKTHFSYMFTQNVLFL